MSQTPTTPSHTDRSASPPAPGPNGSAIEVRGLTKRYGRRTVVNQVDIIVPTGSVTGLIGPNGAGKTTILAMLLGLVRRSGGTGSVLGQSLHWPSAYLHRVGALIETPAFFPPLSARENLEHLSRLGGHPAHQVGSVLELVGLSDRSDDAVGSYSLGMRQRLGIAAALLADPELILLDEPSNGVDPVGMRDLRQIIRHLAGEGRTVVVSSHLLSELEQVCDHLLVLDRGGVVYTGRPENLPRSADEILSIGFAHSDEAGRLFSALRANGFAGALSRDRVTVPTRGTDPFELGAGINALAHGHGVCLGELSHRNTDLESRYLALLESVSSSTELEGAKR